MSEPKLISPLLDGFAIGNALYDHDGIRCFPAVKEHSDNKYIVKVISIPASQVQLDALLLTGAYQDPASAMNYFRELTDGIIAEAEALKKLSRLEGFLPFEDWQIVPMEKNSLGYEIYLTSPYKRSLERHMRRNTMTHLGAVNLGLDMCSALSIARRAGWVYVDVKPSNIFLTEDRGYRIGDLGFVKLDSLKYAAMPRKYCSAYTAPELRDAMATLNDTVDTYALGMLLYQIYNNGLFPGEDQPAGEPLPPPANADYEMAEIILKACAPDPGDRWTDPVEMGQALVAYMQRNTVNDVPIVPPSASLDTAATEIPDTGKKRFVRDETLPGEEDVGTLDTEELSEEMSDMVSRADDLISHETPEPVVVPEPTPVSELQAAAEPEELPETEADTTGEETEAAGEEASPAADSGVEDVEAETEQASEPDPAEEYVDLDARRKRARFKRRLTAVLLLLVLLLAAAGGYCFYRFCYLMTVDGLEVTGSDDTVTVLLDTSIDNSLLTVVCTDTYGNPMSAPVVDNKAQLTGLLPDMLYRIRLEVSGFHGLDGSTTHEYMTPAQTKILSITAATGTEDGSVILNFTVDGPEPDEWIVSYSAEDEPERQISFTGHTVPITGLTVGKTYTFRLSPPAQLYLVGERELTFTASRIVIADNLKVTATAENSLTVSWDAPADAQVESWTVHCYSGDSYDQTITVSETSAVFEQIDLGHAYTVEVTASGMTQPARANVTANPVTITSVDVNADDVTKLAVSWEYEGTAPLGGWLLLYTIDGSDRQEVVQCENNSAVIEIRVPAATYDLSIQAADGSSVFGGSYSYHCPGAAVFEDDSLFFYAKDLTVNLLKTPAKDGWSYKDVNGGDFTTTFSSGDSISVLMHCSNKFYLPKDRSVSVLYVIRNSEQQVMAELIGTEVWNWYTMWWNTDYRYCELNVPAVPSDPGEYTLSIYFNGYAITSLAFSITE